MSATTFLIELGVEELHLLPLIPWPTPWPMAFAAAWLTPRSASATFVLMPRRAVSLCKSLIWLKNNRTVLSKSVVLLSLRLTRMVKPPRQPKASPALAVLASLI